MFTTNVFHWPDRPIARNSVPVGGAFRYVDGRGDIYCHLGRPDSASIPVFLCMKMSSVSSRVASITATPVDSPNVQRECDIVGVYNFILFYKEPARIGLLDQNSCRSFGEIISLPNDLDEHGNSHIYISLGMNIHPSMSEHLFIRVTENIGVSAFKAVPTNTTVAFRGEASVQLKFKED